MPLPFCSRVSNVDGRVVAGADHAAVLEEIWRLVEQRSAEARRERRQCLVTCRT
jgi:hypothetical protein